MNYQWRDFIGSLVDGKYPLIEYLGDVAGDGVYATNPVDSRQAIIRLTPGGTDDAHRILERWQSATTLSHPNLAKTHAAGETEVIGNTVVFTVTERPDDSLGEAVRNRALTEGEAQVLTESVLRALVYLHEHGFAHRAVSPDNIVAVGDDIKLAPWTIARATGKDQGDDMFAVGQTIAEVLTQKRPTGDATLPRSLPQPFADVARACIRKTVEAPEALRLFRAVPEPVVARKFKLPTAALVALSLAVVALLYGVRSYTSSSPSQAAPPAQASPVQDVDRGRNVPPAAAASVPAPRSTRGEWVVVAEIYKQHDQAMKRAEQIAARWKGWRPEVYPPNPGGRRFLVVLGFSETRSGGEQLLARARSAGMGKKVYLTRLQR